MVISSSNSDTCATPNRNCGDNLTVSCDDPTWKIWRKRRYVVAVLSFLGLVNCFIMRVNLSIGVVAMTENKTVLHSNGSVTYVKDFDWDSKMKGYLLSSFYYGYITTQLLGGWLSAKYGGKKLFGIGIVGTATLTLLTPLAANLNVYLLLAVRILEGIFEGTSYPAVQTIWSRWAPPLERTKLACITYSGGYIGTAVAMPLCAYLSTTLGWESVFYFSGALALLWFVLWWMFVFETPSQDRFISNTELKYIQHSLGDEDNLNIVHPWNSILHSIPTIGCAAAYFCEAWGFHTMMTQLPTFLKDTLDFELGQTGVTLALPYIAMTIASQGSGHLADYLRKNKILTTTHVRKIFIIGSFICQATFLIVAIYLVSPVGTIICITFVVGFGGVAACGCSVNFLDIAPQHASIIMGISNTFATVAGIVSPIITGHIVQTASAEEWKIVFFIITGINLVGAVLYGIMGSGEVQPWAMKSRVSKDMEIGT